MFNLKFKQGFVIVGMSVYATSSAFGAIVNTVTVKGTGADEVVDAVTANATASVDVVDADAKLEITKQGHLADTNNNAAADVGEVITYTFAVKNTGNVTLNDVVVTEGAFDGTSGVPIVADNPVLTTDLGISLDSKDEIDSSDDKWEILAPEDIVTFTGNYTVVQTDIDQLQN